MSASLAKGTFIGNLGKDPQVHEFQDGGKVVTLSLAVEHKWRAAGDEVMKKTDWWPVVIRNENLAGIAEQYLKKGSKVYVEGNLEQRSFEDKGVQRTITELVLRPGRGELKLLDSAPKREQAEPPPRTAATSTRATRSAPAAGRSAPRR